MSKEFSYPKDKIKIFLLEKIHQAAKETFEEAGYKVICKSGALEGKELEEVLSEAHVIGVRSRTKIRGDVFSHAKRLLAIGCFSVGTDQVSLDDARGRGIPVYNAPHSSTRSVAELTIANVIVLSRRLAEGSAKMHQGVWNKSAVGSYEVRGKTLGVIGYGHIGQQVALLGEAIGMKVLFHDVVKKLPLGTARPVESLGELLSSSDFVTLHVPGGAGTKVMIGAEELKQMRKGSYLLNLSRGTVVDLAALGESLTSGHIAGAALDVYPSEPASNSDPFSCELSGLDNVVMTPHIGGSTEEAQCNIGREVADSLISFLDNGSTYGAVNFPAVHLPEFPDSHRILNVHQNVPGALKEINRVVYEVGANVDAQYLSTSKDIGYLIMDINKAGSEELRQRISVLPQSIKTRILY